MGLRFDPMGGGQFKAAVQAIIEAERQPINTLEKRKANEEARLKLFSEFKGKFSSLQSALGTMIGFNKFKELKADLGDGEQIMSVSVDKDKAQMGSWDIEVLELAQRSSMISNGFSDPNEKVLGVGYVTVHLSNGDTKDIYVMENDSSLYGVASKINNIPDGVIKATVLKDMTDPERPYRLVLNAKQDGLENEVFFPQLYFVDGEEDFYVDQDRGAQNAIVRIDGYDVEIGSNETPDFLQGIGAQLKQARPGEKFTLSVRADYQKIMDKVKGVIEGTNGILDFINKQNQVNESTDTRTTFAGDTSLQNIEFRLRNLMHEGFAAHLESEEKFRVYQLHELGVQFSKTGAIEFDEAKFQKAMEGDFEGIAEAIAGEKGFVYQLKTVMDGFGAPGVGILSTRESGIKDRIKQIDRTIETKERNLEKKARSVTDQFSRLQGSLAAMQQQQQYLAANLPGAGGGGGISQLLGG